MPPVRFKPTISAGERPQTYALECAANETDKKRVNIILKYIFVLITSTNAVNFTTAITTANTIIMITSEFV
jgi:hypothetical protein